MGRFDHLVHTFEKQITHWGDFMPTVQAYFRGQDCMDGAEFYSPYRCYIKEAFLDRESNFHAEEELLSRQQVLMQVQRQRKHPTQVLRKKPLKQHPQSLPSL